MSSFQVNPTNGVPGLTFTGKFLKFLITILVVPVSQQEDGKYRFKVKCCRFFLANLIWILPLWICNSIILYVRLDVLDLDSLPALITKFGTSGKTISQTLMIPTMGYMVEKAKLAPTDMVKGSDRFLINSYYASLLFEMIYDIFMVAALENYLVNLMEIFVSYFNNVIMTSSIVIVRMYSTAFVAKCKEVTITRNVNELLEKSENMLEIFRSLNVGFGPLLLVLHSFGTLSIIGYLYLMTTQALATDHKLHVNLFTKSLQMLLISLACQQCYVELRDTKQTLR